MRRHGNNNSELRGGGSGDGDAHPAPCGTINHRSKERGNSGMMNRPLKPEFCTGRPDERRNIRGRGMRPGEN